jgi:hypothetical protein
VATSSMPTSAPAYIIYVYLALVAAFI